MWILATSDGDLDAQHNVLPDDHDTPRLATGDALMVDRRDAEERHKRKMAEIRRDGLIRIAIMIVAAGVIIVLLLG